MADEKPQLHSFTTEQLNKHVDDITIPAAELAGYRGAAMGVDLFIKMVSGEHKSSGNADDDVTLAIEQTLAKVIHIAERAKAIFEKMAAGKEQEIKNRRAASTPFSIE